jgi:hypothetical protein
MSSTEVEPRPGGQASAVFVFAAVIGLARACARIAVHVGAALGVVIPQAVGYGLKKLSAGSIL